MFKEYKLQKQNMMTKHKKSRNLRPAFCLVGVTGFECRVVRKLYPSVFCDQALSRFPGLVHFSGRTTRASPKKQRCFFGTSDPPDLSVGMR